MKLFFIKTLIFLFLTFELACAQDQGFFQMARVKYSGGGDWYNDQSAEVNLLNFVNRNKHEYEDIGKALVLSSLQRIRPIIMTTCTTIAGLMPLAIGLPSFSRNWGPFATCFIAGLSMSTLMTLMILPVIYSLIDQLRNYSLNLCKCICDHSSENSER